MEYRGGTYREIFPEFVSDNDSTLYQTSDEGLYISECDGSGAGEMRRREASFGRAVVDDWGRGSHYRVKENRAAVVDD